MTRRRKPRRPPSPATRERPRRAREAFVRWKTTGLVQIDDALDLAAPDLNPSGTRTYGGELSSVVHLVEPLWIEVVPTLRHIPDHDRWLVQSGDRWLVQDDDSEAVAVVEEWLRYRSQIAQELAQSEAQAWGEDNADARAAGLEARAEWLAVDPFAAAIASALGRHKRVRVFAEYSDRVQDVRGGVELRQDRGHEYVVLPSVLNPRKA